MFKKRSGLIFGIAAALILIGHIFWLAWLFWGMTLVGIFWVPAMGVISLIAGAGIFLFMGGVIKARKVIAVSFSIIIFIAVLFLQIGTYPLNINDGLFKRVGNYWDVYWEYPEGIEYEDLFRDGPRQDAALIKYAENIPEKAFVVEFDQGEGLATICYAAYKDGKIEYDSTRYQMLETGENITLIINPDSSSREEYILSGNYTHWLEECLDVYISFGRQNGRTFSYSSIDFKDVVTYQDGATQIFSFLIRHFR